MGAVGGVAGWRLVVEGGVGSMAVISTFPVADDDPGLLLR